MKDRPFEVGFREQASNHPKRHWSKACVVSVGEKAGDTCQVWITETSVSEPLMTCRKVPWRRRNQERVSLLGQGWGVPDDGPTGVRHEGGVTVILASMRNVRTCGPDAKGDGQAGSPCKTLSTEAGHRGGATRSRDEGPVMGLDRRGCIVPLWTGINQRWEESRG
jgi:RNA-directed DNA polymerase